MLKFPPTLVTAALKSLSQRFSTKLSLESPISRALMVSNYITTVHTESHPSGSRTPQRPLPTPASYSTTPFCVVSSANPTRLDDHRPIVLISLLLTLMTASQPCHYQQRMLVSFKSTTTMQPSRQVSTS